MTRASGAGARAATSASDHDSGLQSCLSAMAQLSSDALGLEDVLTRVAGFAVAAIPNAEGAGVTLIDLDRHDRPDTVVASTPFVNDVDEVQYRLGEGPCISATADRRTVRSGSLGGESRWPRFGSQADRLGVHSVLSLPLLLAESGHAVGAINVYAHPRNAFDERAQELGELFASPAAVVARNAQILAQARRASQNLRTELSGRAVIDQAIGILISRSGSSAEEAFNTLRVMSQRDKVKLVVVAANLVAEAARRARARRTE